MERRHAEAEGELNDTELARIERRYRVLKDDMRSATAAAG
jgi:hypothetical protein